MTQTICCVFVGYIISKVDCMCLFQNLLVQMKKKFQEHLREKNNGTMETLVIISNLTLDSISASVIFPFINVITYHFTVQK